jgi:hypothetical protein
MGLVLRQQVDRRLEIEEMDGNFLYLEGLIDSFSASVNSTFSVIIPEQRVAFGSGVGLTSSEFFKFDLSISEKS